ncbi:M24 family metallopeptidase [Alkalicoccobacillus porphyridii]|uniref:Aminopeptidase P family protein n=1 Tax=Alkalicoccobacillus porphyridii TaxID=2597270 RepID=A0A553ZVF4_9BACI|nr:Xaa-Pro peptidase family protein [Alkalicoccobacillus porphyridii]TSB45403.1 aminopeptidase P family protein [Alkalicoccobacillus porphyridii]
MSRIEAIRSEWTKNEVDGLLIMSPYNRRYVSGFTGSAGAILLSNKEAVFITDFRYTEQAKEQTTGFTIVQQKGSIIEEIGKQAEKLHITKLGFEKSHVTYEQFQQLQQSVVTATLTPVSGLVEGVRLIKDSSEIQLIQDAADIADAAYTHILSYVQPGMTELEVSNELEFFMRKQGAQSSSFDIIVASGHRSALPHGVASGKLIETGELVTLDFGAYYKGYCSDITRTFAVGSISDELNTIYHTVLEAQLRGMNGIKAGITGKEADALTRDYIKEKGYGEYFGHSTGHGLGMEVHESPSLSFKSDNVLEPGMVVTVEPGIYVHGVGGTRIEDDILITAEGNRSFTSSSKELIHVGV